jgi:YD repeat-containing protein
MNPLVTIANTFYYDQVGRKLSTWEQITNGSSAPTAKTLISKITYNEIGQVITKNLHSTDSLNYLQNVAYAYNERGWLLSNTAPLFQMQLQYNTANISGLGNVVQYNGNISTQSWGTAAAPNTTSSVYLYDNLNRLTSANNTAGYSENNITYDGMGNLTQLYRYTAGASLIDQLTYAYAGGGNATNQLVSVVDNSGSNAGLVNGTTAYTWDNNGNMLSSSNTTNTAQNKSFTYNHLNLPMVATFAAGTATYTYDATGNKLRKVDLKSGATTATDYINGIEYDNSTTTIGFIQTEEGRALPNGANAYNYEYYLGDNLGNTRVRFDTGTGVARQVQSDDYYPFGLEIPGGTLSGQKMNTFTIKRSYRRKRRSTIMAHGSMTR